MTDIGKGDVVSAVRQRIVAESFTPGRGAYVIFPGARAIVAAITDPRPNFCDTCGEMSGPGLILEEYPLVRGLSWCLCEWRRVGGDKAKHVGYFAEYLKDKTVVEELKKLERPGILRRFLT